MPQKHRVRNWRAYNKALRKRGDLFLYFDEVFLKTNWLYEGKRNSGGRIKYSNTAIQLMLTIRSFLRLPLRQAQGFVASIIQRLGLCLPVPDYTTTCRRAKTLSLKIKHLNKLDPQKPLHLLIDSTGLSIYSGTYFHAAKYGNPRRIKNGKAWKKLHIAFDVTSSQIANAHLSESNVQDAACVEKLTNDPGVRIQSITADRAYDKARCYQRVHELGAEAIIPPYRNARLQKENRNRSFEEALKVRDESITLIRKYPTYDEGVKEWKLERSYHKRSKIEALMHRFKRAFGFSLVSKNMDSMQSEVTTKVNILNLQRSLGGAHFELVT